MSEQLDHILLAYALQNKQFTMALQNHTTYEYFANEVQWLYKAILDYFSNPKYKELPTKAVIEDTLTKSYSPDFVATGLSLFDTISTLSPDPKEFNWHLEKLKVRRNEQINRSCAESISHILSTETNETERIAKVNEVVRKSVVAVDALYKQEAFDEGPLNESAKERARDYKELEANPDIAKGVYSGFSELDRITNGFHQGELIIIGGETGTGKSILMHNMALNAYLGKHNPLNPAPDPKDIVGGRNVLYFSLEMPKQSQERRLDAAMANVIANEIRDGRLSKEDKEAYFKVLKFQANYSRKFHIVDMPRHVTPREIELKYVELKDLYGIEFDLVVIDYLGLMNANQQKEAQDWFELGCVAEELHEFARTYKVPVITATQLNKSKDPTKPMHSTARIARSNMIPDNANIILQIDCRGEDEHTRLDMPIFIVKCRDGERGTFTLTKDFPRMKVVDIVDVGYANTDLEDVF